MSLLKESLRSVRDGAWDPRRPLSALVRRGRGDIAHYVGSVERPRLNVGAGNHILPGWLNTDLRPTGDAVYLDATRPIPAPDGSFDYIFCEHLIEHLPLADGLVMLREFRRVLSPEGVLRLGTPDFAFLVDLWSLGLSPDHRDYVEWSLSEFTPDAPLRSPMVVINNFVRDWGHTFIYDEDMLRDALAEAGFDSARRVGVGQSEHALLAGIDNEDRMPAGFLALESIYLEADGARS